MSEVQSPKIEKTMSIGEFACWLILNKPAWSNEQILNAVREVFPDAKTSMASISWYKSDLRKKGLLLGKAGSARSINQDAMSKYLQMAGAGAEAEGNEHSSEPETEQADADVQEA